MLSHPATKQVISGRGKDEEACEMSKLKDAREKRSKLLFFIVKYANLWPSSWLLTLPICTMVNILQLLLFVRILYIVDKLR